MQRTDPSRHVTVDIEEQTLVKNTVDTDEICEKDVSMEDGQLGSENEDSWDINSVAELLKDYNSLRSKVAKMEESHYCETKLKDTVTNIVKDVLIEFKRDIIHDLKKELKLETIQSEIKKNVHKG